MYIIMWFCIECIGSVLRIKQCALYFMYVLSSSVATVLYTSTGIGVFFYYFAHEKLRIIVNYNKGWVGNGDQMMAAEDAQGAKCLVYLGKPCEWLYMI